MDVLLGFSFAQLAAVAFLFVWGGFVRTGLGFGGAALGLPPLLMVFDEPIFWLPIIGTHLLFFSGLTLRTRMSAVDFPYLKRACLIIIPFALLGVFGLIQLPSGWLVLFIYLISLFYGILWLIGVAVKSSTKWVDRFLLALGGYIAGVSLTGAPLMVAVFMRNVAADKLRNTLFLLWFSLVSIKMITFMVFGVNIQFLAALSLIPVAFIGHVLGLKAHQHIVQKDQLFKRFVGGGLTVVSFLGLLQYATSWAGG